jgi:hypothetical protein
MRRRRRLRIKLEPSVIECEDDEGLVEAMAGLIQETRNVPAEAARRWARLSIYGRTDPRPATEETQC